MKKLVFIGLSLMIFAGTAWGFEGEGYGVDCPRANDSAVLYKNGNQCDGESAYFSWDDTNKRLNVVTICDENGANCSSVSSGMVTGPGSSTDNAVARFNGTNGSVIQSSGLSINDSGTAAFNDSVKIPRLELTPHASQYLTANDSTITLTRSHFRLSSNDSFVMVSTPTIADGKPGDFIIVHNNGSFSIDFQDNDSLGGSGIALNSSAGTLRPEGIITFLWDASTSLWHIVSNPATSIGGAPASTLEVRNQSGVAIAAGKAVYASGYNVGLQRILIGLADADDSTKMPAIGVVAAAISNGQNGEVISAGNAIGIIDTSTASVNDGVWVSTTAGNVVFTKPTVDEIQRLGTVIRKNANGSILVQGAGRTNDVPVEITAPHIENTSRRKVTANDSISNDSLAYGGLILFDNDSARHRLDLSWTLANNQYWVTKNLRASRMKVCFTGYALMIQGNTLTDAGDCVVNSNNESRDAFLFSVDVDNDTIIDVECIGDCADGGT